MPVAAAYLAGAAIVNALAALYNGRKGRDQAAEEHAAHMALQQVRLDLDHARFQWERERERQQAEAQRQAAIEQARFRLREVAYSAEMGRVYQDWPLNHLMPSAFRRYFEGNRPTIPLQVLLTPIPSLSKLAWTTVERALLEFTSEFYAEGLSERPITFHHNEWRAGSPVSRGAFEKIHTSFDGAPFVIVEAVETERGLGFSLAYWGQGFGDTHCRPLGSAVPYADFGGLPGSMDAERLAEAYKLIVAGAADIHHLAHGGTAPILPALLPRLIGSGSLAREPGIVRETLRSYRTAYNSLFATERMWMPERLLELTASLVDLDDKSLACEQCEEVVRLYVQVRGGQENGDLSDTLINAVRPGDGPFLSRLGLLLEQAGATRLAIITQDAANHAGLLHGPSPTPTSAAPNQTLPAADRFTETMREFRRLPPPPEAQSDAKRDAFVEQMRTFQSNNTTH